MITTFLYDRATGNLERGLGPERFGEVLADPGKLLWVDLENPDETEYAILKDRFDFHPLLIRDCIDPQNFPKCDDMNSYIFLVLHSLYYYLDKREEEALSIREIDIFAGSNYLITVHAGHIKAVTANRKRLEHSDKIMRQGTGRLLYHLVDSIVDNYMAIIHTLTEKADVLEDNVLAGCKPDQSNRILSLRRNTMTMRKTLLPQTELIYNFSHGKINFVKPEELIYFRDIYDHMTRIADLVDHLREMSHSLLEAYHSSLSFKLNDVMRILTVIATIMMPMTLISGIGGMNVLFPLHLRETMLGFWIFIFLMALSVSVLLYWFKKIKLL
ncbi:MAG TPA: magnesium/cobalt transporter CorA [bacterium]|nr:magnesium/cobalt transporter CorA [bacterium]HPJ71636.1 magnesium/cobalt transporter CorA [bacterium]HPQ65233.1 magnesium/cobalt transporter CorA [bacterium]